MKRTLAVGIATMTMIAAHAQASSILATGHLFGGPQLNEVACYVNNVGTKAVTNTSLWIFDVGGNLLAGTNCGSLGKGGECFTYSRNPDSGQVYSCQARADALGTLRGSIELRNSSGSATTVLNSEALR